MKQLLVLLTLAITLTSCSKQHNCVCKLTKTQYAIREDNGTVETTIKGTKKDAQAQCKAEEAKHTSHEVFGYYTTFYEAICDLE